ncbi:Uncharacterized protein QTN25_008255 [Entamoeba marina]
MQDTLAIYHQQLPETTIKYQTAKSRERLTREITQITVLIAVLNDYFGFTINKPFKKASGQLAYPSISTIYQGKDEVDVVEFLKIDVNPEQRMVNNNKRIVLNNYLIDLAILSGVHITIKKTNRGNVEQMDRIQSVRIGGTTIDWKEIEQLGVQLNQSLMKSFEKEPFKDFKIQTLSTEMRLFAM